MKMDATGQTILKMQLTAKTTADLRSLRDIGRQGLAMWDKSDRQYKNAEIAVKLISDELKRRHK